MECLLKQKIFDLIDTQILTWIRGRDDAHKKISNIVILCEARHKIEQLYPSVANKKNE